MERLPVALYASDPITTAGIAALLREGSDFQLVPEPQHAAAEVLVVAADQLTLDVMRVMRTAARQSAPPRIVLIVDELRRDDIDAAAACGVVRVLSRQHLADKDLVAAVSSIDRDRQRPTASLHCQVEHVSRDVLRPKGSGHPILTPRETDVIRLLAEGHDTAAIASMLCYSERTVKNILQVILTRLRLRNRAHAVAYAMRVGVI